MAAYMTPSIPSEDGEKTSFQFTQSIPDPAVGESIIIPSGVEHVTGIFTPVGLSAGEIQFSNSKRETIVAGGGTWTSWAYGLSPLSGTISLPASTTAIRCVVAVGAASMRLRAA